MRVGSRPRCWGTVGSARGAILGGGLVACKTPQPASAPAVVKKPPPLSFHAELGPITALAWDDPFLWIGTERGLRRYRPGTNEELWLSNEPSKEQGKDPANEHGKNQAMLGHHITALAPASGPSLLVATEGGVARLSAFGGDKPVLLQVAVLPGVYRMAAVTDTTPVPQPGPSRATPAVNPLAWLATDRGLYLFDGAAVHMITPVSKGAQKNAIAFLQADPDGRSAWAGMAGQGLLHVDGHGTLQLFGPAGEGAPDFPDTLGMGTFPNGT